MPDAENASNVQYPANPDDWIKWTQRWWEAMLEIPKGSNPIADPDGTYFKTFKQPADAEDVWFIGGGLNDEDIRKIDVKKGKAIFGPIVNYIACKNPGFGKSNLYGAPQGSSLEQEVKDIDNCDFGVEFTGHVSEMVRDRVRTPRWHVNFSESPVMGDMSGTAECVSDGYWFFTKPLVDVGETAIIRIHASNNEDFRFSVTYEISIVP